MVNHIIICSHSFVYFPFFPLFPLNSLLFQMPPFDLHPIWFFYSEYATFCDSALFEFCACFALCVCTMYIYIVRCLHGDFKTEQLNINASFLSQHNRNALLNTHSRNIFTVVWKRKMNGVHVICYFCFEDLVCIVERKVWSPIDDSQLLSLHISAFFLLFLHAIIVGVWLTNLRY